MPPYARVINSPSVFPEPDVLSPAVRQVSRPRPVADAINPLIGLKINPPAFPPQPFPATEQAGPTVARAALADTPLPPSRPPGLGAVLSRAVVADPSPPPLRPQSGQQQQAPQPLTANDLFGTVQLNPSQRNAPVYTALNLGGLFGGGGGSGGNRSQPVAPTRTSTPTRAAPDMTGVTFDENGNPVPDYGPVGAGLQPQDPTQLASTVGRANWWKSLR